MKLTEITSWEEGVEDMCETATEHRFAVRLPWRGGIQLGAGTNPTTYNHLCECEYTRKYITELIEHKYLAHLCRNCNEIKVVDMVRHGVYTAYPGTGCELTAMCSGPGQGSLLVWDNKDKAVIHLQWSESRKKLDEIRRVQVPGEWVDCMCYVAQANMAILSRGDDVVEAVRLQGGGQPPVWQVQGEVLGKEIDPRGVRSDSEGRVYIADGVRNRVLVVNGRTGEVIQENLKDAGLGVVWSVCCLSNPSQLLLHHYPHTITLYDITSL